MNIRQRILLLIALSFAALLFIGGFAIFQNSSSTKEVKGVTEGVVPSTLKSVELMGQLKDVQIATLAMVSAADTASVKQAHEEVKEKKASLQKALADQMAAAENDTQRGLIKQAEESLQNYFGAIDDTANFMLQGQKEMAEATMAATVDQYLREQGSVIETVQVEKRRSKDAAIATLNDNLKATTGTLSVVTLVAVLGLCAMGLLLYRQIIHPMAEMEAKMTEIADSQDYTHRVPVKRMDEIGRSLSAFNTMIGRIQETSEEVRQKTADIHAMLHYIPQGILTLEADGTIHPEYSEHLKTVLETSDVAGLPVMEVVFGGVNLGADSLDQIKTAISACIGEDEMNFEFNAHLLPTEIEKTFADGRTKILDLNWSPITDESGTTLRLLLCLRDVTEMRALTRAADAQKRELAIIGEILAVRQEQFEEFISGSLQFIEENRRLIDATDDSEHRAVVDVLFRNMHTIKGNARTYGLLQLTNGVHHAEQRYDDIRKGQAAWDRAQLQSELEQTRRTIEEYARINAEKLGRKVQGRSGSDDKFLMVPQDQVHALLHSLDAVDSPDSPALAQALAHTRQVLNQLGTDALPHLLSGVLSSLPSLASELGKEVPTITIADHQIAVRTQLADTLRNVCMHLYRNAIDHGIETAAERVAAGKPAAGTVHMEVALTEQALTLTLRDDGRGLAMDRIQQKAIEKGVIAADEALQPQEIAQLVFASGFSTADAVTEVSGRGVGMDAVKSFVLAEGGDIALVLHPDHTPHANGYCPFETVITLPAKFAVRKAA